MKTNLKKLMLDRDIDSLSELERQMKVKKINISRTCLDKLKHEKSLEQTKLITVLKLCSFFEITIGEFIEL